MPGEDNSLLDPPYTGGGVPSTAPVPLSISSETLPRNELSPWQQVVHDLLLWASPSVFLDVPLLLQQMKNSFSAEQLSFLKV
jgi:hypothetical protein